MSALRNLLWMGELIVKPDEEVEANWLHSLCSLLQIMLLLFFIVVLGEGYIVAITKVLTIYQISYVNSPLSPFSFFSPSPNSWNYFNRYHFSIHVHGYTVFILYSPSHILSPPPPSSQCYHPPAPGSTCSAFLFFDFIKKKWHFCLSKIATQGVSLCISMYIYIYIYIYI
jgi:hypothetical protein